MDRRKSEKNKIRLSEKHLDTAISFFFAFPLARAKEWSRWVGDGDEGK